MRDVVTTLLDALGLLLIAGGVGGALWPYLGGAALAVAGLMVLAGSQLAARMSPVPVVRGDEV